MNWKKYLPYENYVIQTKLSVDEVMKRLNENIEPKKFVRLPSFNNYPIKPYEGKIVGSNFTISRIIQYRNSFLPVVKGEISTFLSQTQIRVKMQPPTYVILFMSIWLGIIGIACIGIIIVGISKYKEELQNGFSPMLLIPFVMFAFGALLTTFAFKIESKKTKQFLDRILEGREDQARSIL